MTDWIEFNIHDYAAIRVAAKAPTAPLLKDMMAPFLTKGLSRYDLTINHEFEPMGNVVRGEAHGETEFSYNDTAVFLDASETQIINANGSGWKLNGKRELLVSALPLIDRILVGRGVAMIHAATYEYKGHGVCMPAWGGTGKTSTLAKLLKIEGVGFMGDDWAFLTKEGMQLAYFKPMSIKPYHKALYPHLFNKIHKPLVPNAISKQVHALTTRVHPLITQYPRLASITRRYSPEHMMVTPQQAFPNAKMTNAAPLGLAIFVERHSESSVNVAEHTTDWMMTRLLGNFHSELTKYSRQVITALGASGIAPLEKMIGEKAEVLRQGLKGVPIYQLQVPKAWAPDQAAGEIVEQMMKVLEKIGIK